MFSHLIFRYPWQEAHAVDPPGEYWPLGHTVHEDNPLAALYEPGSQLVHDIAPN